MSNVMTFNSFTDLEQRILQVVHWLSAIYPELQCDLNYDSPFQLLVATILAPQTTDEIVNEVTPTLFARFPTAQMIAEAKREEIEAIIRPTGFYRQKAKHLQMSCRILLERYHGVLPLELTDLTKLPGISRKNGNQIIAELTGRPAGIFVDNHVRRLAERIGLAEGKSIETIEHKLMDITPRDYWLKLPRLFVTHGETVCTIHNPLCAQCPLNHLCPSAQLGDNAINKAIPNNRE